MSSDDSLISTQYQDWLVDLKGRFRAVQMKAAVAVNTELLTFYWELGGEIVAKQVGQHWDQGSSASSVRT